MGYDMLLQDHISKEDNILYPMAEEALDAATKLSMLERFNRSNMEKFPEGAEERFLAIVREFERRWE